MPRVMRPGGVAAVKDPYYPAFTFRPQTLELALLYALSPAGRVNVIDE
jgi:hypothetical protein